MVWFFNQLACLPLSVLHRLGVAFGWVTYWSSERYAERLRENLRHGLQFSSPPPDRGRAREGVESLLSHQVNPHPNLPPAWGKEQFQKVLHANISEAGKSVMELPWVWLRPLDEVVASVVQCHGWEFVEAARAQGKGVIVLTPHFGCFELIGLYVAARLPMTCLYRRPHWQFLDTLMHEGRERGQMKLAPADLGGVRLLLKALKRGEIIGILPDQVPGNGEGEWVPFFGRPAYTMTLIGRLIQSSGAAVVMCHAERLPCGKGYIMRFAPLSFDTTAPISPQMNAALEAVVCSCPEQYLWSYNRYKVPRGVVPLDAVKEQA